MQRRGQIVIVSGEPGSGKTTRCAQRIAQARAQGWDVAGVLSPARFEHSAKVCIDALDLRSGELRPLAYLRAAEAESTAAGIVTQRWRFDPASLAWANQALASATPCDLLIVDELGPLELEQGRGWMAGLTAVATRTFDLALVVVRTNLLPLALARWPDAEVVQVEQHAS